MMDWRKRYFIPPTCAVCNRPVEQIVVSEDLADPLEWKLAFTVHCHGAFEIVKVDERELMLAERIEFGVAFSTGGQLAEGVAP